MNGISAVESLNKETITEALNAVQKWGFGGTARMVDLLPLVLLFSYTRSHKLPLLDTAIPIAGVVAIVIVYLDGFFQILQVFLNEFLGAVQEVMPLLEVM